MPTSTEPIYAVQEHGRTVFAHPSLSVVGAWRDAHSSGSTILEDGEPIEEMEADLSKVIELMNLPTPDEIRERCEAIQATWTPLERERRATGERQNTLAKRSWTVPVVRVGRGAH